MPEDIAKLKYSLGYSFRDISILREALTHRSYAAENNLKYDNQRLEFLGDAVLEIVLTEHLFRLYPEADEGLMTKMRSALVRQDSLAQIARKLHFGDFLITGKGELESGGNQRESTLADLFEAILGAFYLDGGFEPVRTFLIKQFTEEFPEPVSMLTHINPKGILQEYSQRKWNCAPIYTVLNISGPEHNPCFQVQVSVGGIVALGNAHNRRQAESQAAREAINILSEKDPAINHVKSNRELLER